MGKNRKMFDLTGSGVGVTGGGGSLGSAMALGLAEAGATVVICGRTEGKMKAVRDKAIAAKARGQVIPMVANIRDNKAVDAVLEKIEEKTGRLVGWINNAYEGHSGLLLDASEKDMLDSVEFGLVRVMGITQRVAKRMIAGGGGSIINISTMYGMVSPQPDTYLNFPKFHNPPAYGAAKAGLIQYTRYAACHLAKQGIRVNAISPGPFPHGEPAQEQGFIEELCRRVPMGRVGKPEDVAGAAVFLISNASAYITGQNLAIDGGWTAW